MFYIIPKLEFFFTPLLISVNNHINNHKSVSYNKSQNFSNTTFQVVISDFVENTLAQLLLLSLLYFVLWFEENLKISMKKRISLEILQINLDTIKNLSKLV